MSSSSNNDEMQLAESVVEAEEINEFVFDSDEFWNSVKALYDEKCQENGGSNRYTVRQLKLKWHALMVPLRRFHDIYVRRTIEWEDREENTNRSMSYEIIEETIQQSCAEYSTIYRQPFTKTDIWFYVTEKLGL